MTPNWRDSSACRNEDPDLHFPDGKTGLHLLQVKEAKAVCAGCWVADQCLEDAMRIEGGTKAAGRYGIHGGLDPDERYRLHQRHLKQRAQQRRRQAVTA